MDDKLKKATEDIEREERLQRDHIAYDQVLNAQRQAEQQMQADTILQQQLAAQNNTKGDSIQSTTAIDPETAEKNVNINGDNTWYGIGQNHTHNDDDIWNMWQEDRSSVHDTTLYGLTNEDFQNTNSIFHDILFEVDTHDLLIAGENQGIHASAGALSEGVTKDDVSKIATEIANNKSFQTDISNLVSSQLDSMFRQDPGLSGISTNKEVQQVLENHSYELAHGNGSIILSSSEVSALQTADSGKWANQISNEGILSLDKTIDPVTKQSEWDQMAAHVQWQQDFDNFKSQSLNAINDFLVVASGNNAEEIEKNINQMDAHKMQRAVSLIAGMSLKDDLQTQAKKELADGVIDEEQYQERMKKANGISANIGQNYGDTGHMARQSARAQRNDKILDYGNKGDDFTGTELKKTRQNVRRAKRTLREIDDLRREARTHKLENKARKRPDNEKAQRKYDHAKRSEEIRKRTRAIEEGKAGLFSVSAYNQERINKKELRHERNKYWQRQTRKRRDQMDQRRIKRARSRNNIQQANRIEQEQARRHQRETQREQRSAEKLKRSTDRERNKRHLVRSNLSVVGARWSKVTQKYYRGRRVVQTIVDPFGTLKNKVSEYVKKAIVDALKPMLKWLGSLIIANLPIILIIMIILGFTATIFGTSKKTADGQKDDMSLYQQLASDLEKAQYDFQTTAEKEAQEVLSKTENTAKVKEALDAAGVKHYKDFDVNIETGRSRHIVDEYGNECVNMNTYVPILIMAKFRFFDVISEDNYPLVKNYAEYLWGGSDEFDSSDLEAQVRENVSGIGYDAVVTSTGSKQFSYQSWKGNPWTGANHQVKYYPDSADELTISFDADGDNWLCFGKNEGKCAYTATHHDNIEDCDHPEHHGENYKDKGNVIDSNFDGTLDKALGDVWVETTFNSDCDDYEEIQGDLKADTPPLHKHVNWVSEADPGCYDTDYVWNGTTYETRAEAEGALKAAQDTASANASTALTNYTSALDTAVANFKNAHPNYSAYVLACTGNSPYSMAFKNTILGLNGNTAKIEGTFNGKKVKIAKASNIYDAWVKEAVSTYSAAEAAYNTAAASSVDTTITPVCGDEQGKPSNCDGQGHGMVEHYDEDWYEKHPGELRYYGWKSKDKTGDYNTWYICHGHCPGHLTPLIDYAFVSDVDNLMAFDTTNLTELRSFSQKIGFHNDMPSQSALEGVRGFNDTWWDHWSDENKDWVHLVAGTRNDEYKDGLTWLQNLGVQTKTMGCSLTEADIAALNKLIPTEAQGCPPKTQAMLQYAIDHSGGYFRYADPSTQANMRLSNNPPMRDCSSFVSEVINSAYPGTVPIGSTTATFRDMVAETPGWSNDIITPGTVMVNRHHVIMIISTDGDGVTFVDCNLRSCGQPEGSYVRHRTWENLRSNGYNWIIKLWAMQ